MCFARVCESFTAVVLTAATRVQCVWFLENFIFWMVLLSTDKKKRCGT